MYRYYKADPEKNEKIRYLDVNSLYPFVNKYGTYPVGHPKVLIGKDIPADLKNITGIAKVRLLPPKQLYLPVLPMKVNKKLVFALCYTCALQENQQKCSHTDEQRELIGTYTCLELNKAVEKGYKIKEIYEVWAYHTTKYNIETNSGGLFAKYINTLIKIKQEASGFPSHVQSEDEKQQFIRDLQEREGVTLEMDKIAFNPGLRSLSKLCLNR